MNRREYLTAMGATALSSSLPRSTTSSEAPSPTEFLVSSTEIPDAFTRVSTPKDVPFFERLRSVDASFADATFAGRGFWARGTEENPLWVLTTLAYVVPDGVPLESVIRATTDSHHEFVNEYDEETPPSWRFENRHERHSGYLDWNVDIWIDEMLLEGPQREGGRHTFTETMRLHLRGPVALLTNLFGPVDQSFQEWPYERFLSRITEYQQEKLNAAGDGSTDLSLGDFE
ncbi:hypothetical protein [Salinigranum halophilum]|uniref:hypothetical protein n=1 Tax=Salinigranum halophilum TaxID=2565931 RepID=UPI00115E2D31|nr:hypothetical protein [Salinigranum halophilum]